jgi:hypothetical protein
MRVIPLLRPYIRRRERENALSVAHCKRVRGATERALGFGLAIPFAGLTYGGIVTTGAHFDTAGVALVPLSFSVPSEGRPSLWFAVKSMGMLTTV